MMEFINIFGKIHETCGILFLEKFFGNIDVEQVFLNVGIYLPTHDVPTSILIIGR